MEKLSFCYLLKNILTPNKKIYKLHLFEKINIFINNVRWRAILRTAKKPLEIPKQEELKNCRSSQQVNNLIEFKDDLVRIVKELQFCKVKNG